MITDITPVNAFTALTSGPARAPFAGDRHMILALRSQG
jgi:hypothetical protein